MVLLSEKQQRDLLIMAGLADFLVGGKLTAAARRGVVSVLRRAVPVAARGAAGFVPRAAGTIGMLAMRHPYVAGAAVLYVGYQERDKIRSLLEQGYEIVEERLPAAPTQPQRPAPTYELEIAGLARRPVTEALFPGGLPAFDPKKLRPRKKSAFNKAVSKGMKAVKGSTSYGKRGVITNAKKAFSMVAKVASAKKKKKKAPKSGIRRKVWSAIGRYV